jgi:hypothetical protein
MGHIAAPKQPSLRCNTHLLVVVGHPQDAALRVHGAVERRPDPQQCVRREAAAAGGEALRGGAQAREAGLVHVALGHRLGVVHVGGEVHDQAVRRLVGCWSVSG